MEIKLENQKTELKRQIRFFQSIAKSSKNIDKELIETFIYGNESLIKTIEKMSAGTIQLTESMINSIDNAIEKNKTLLISNKPTMYVEA